MILLSILCDVKWKVGVYLHSLRLRGWEPSREIMFRTREGQWAPLEEWQRNSLRTNGHFYQTSLRAPSRAYKRQMQSLYYFLSLFTTAANNDQSITDNHHIVWKLKNLIVVLLDFCFINAMGVLFQQAFELIFADIFSPDLTTDHSEVLHWARYVRCVDWLTCNLSFNSGD